MFNDIAKMAFFIGVLAVLAAAGMQRHWFVRGGAAMQALVTPRVGAAPPAAAPDYSLNYASTTQAPSASHPSWGTVEISPDRNAQYQTEVEINGVRVHALIDTGATLVALTAEDARALNIDPPPSAYTLRMSTANGENFAAPVHLRQAHVGEITVYDVDAVVVPPGKLQMTLLGMSFLKKLSSFQNADGRMVLKQ